MTLFNFRTFLTTLMFTLSLHLSALNLISSFTTLRRYNLITANGAGTDFIPTDKSVLSSLQDSPTPEGSGIGKYYQDTLSILAKVPLPQLREFIERLKPSVLPDLTSDSETHISAALDSAWTHSQGDWDGMLTMLREEFSSVNKEALFQLEVALAAAKRLSEKRIKELIVKYSSVNAIPKLDKQKFTGKLLKDDFAVELIDLLREQNQNDYELVARILESDYQSSKKSGFGK